jgi:hypothetical protein
LENIFFKGGIMCLSTIDKETKKDVEYGYKIFYIINNEIYGEYFTPRGKPYELNKWYKATNETLINYRCKEYESGFHILLNLKEAYIYKYISSNWISIFPINNLHIFKVEIHNIVVSGTQRMNHHDLECVVAKEMKILKEV